MLNTMEAVLWFILWFIAAYAIVDRICKCVEQNALIRGYNEYISDKCINLEEYVKRINGKEEPLRWEEQNDE